MTILKIMKRILPIVFLVFGGYYCMGQSVLSSQGDISKGDAMSLTWTLGELSIASIQTANGLITEGFHQPQLQVASVQSKQEKNVSPFTVSVFPNPVQGILNIKNTSTEENTLTIFLYDATGQKVLQVFDKTKAKNTSIDLSNLANGLYLLSIKDENGLIIETFKITKS